MKNVRLAVLGVLAFYSSFIVIFYRPDYVCSLNCTFLHFAAEIEFKLVVFALSLIVFVIIVFTIFTISPVLSLLFLTMVVINPRENMSYLYDLGNNQLAMHCAFLYTENGTQFLECVGEYNSSMIVDDFDTLHTLTCGYDGDRFGCVMKQYYNLLTYLLSWTHFAAMLDNASYNFCNHLDEFDRVVNARHPLYCY